MKDDSVATTVTFIFFILFLVGVFCPVPDWFIGVFVVGLPITINIITSIFFYTVSRTFVLYEMAVLSVFISGTSCYPSTASHTTEVMLAYRTKSVVPEFYNKFRSKVVQNKSCSRR